MHVINATQPMSGFRLLINLLDFKKKVLTVSNYEDF
jgi:hypothetical protein